MMQRKKINNSGRGINRRVFIKAGLAGAAALSIPGFSRKALGADEKTLVVQTWGGAIREVMKDVWFSPFTKKTGIKIITADQTGGILPQIKAMVESNNVEWDIASGLGLSNVTRLTNANLLEPLEYSVINTTDIYEDGIMPTALGCWVISDGLVYNTEKFPKGKNPKNWADFWNVQKFPGPRALTAVPSTAVMDNLAFALLADGVPKDKIYPYDLDRAFKKLDEIKPHITAWWSSGAHSQQLFTDQEVWLGSMWNGRAMQIKKKGVPIELIWSDARLTYNYWVVPKNAPNKKAAMEFLNFVSQAKPQSGFTEKMFYGPVNRKSFETMPEDLAKDINTYPPNKELHYKPDEEWLAANEKELIEKWQTWISS